MRVFTKWFLSVMLLCVAGVVSAADYVIDHRFTSIDELLDGSPSFAIVNEATSSAFYGSDNQNLKFGDFVDAFQSTNSGYYFKLEQAEEADGYLFHLYKPDGSAYGIWGSPGYLNSQPSGICFILGIQGTSDNPHVLGQDGDYLALWELEEVDGKFAIKNVGAGGYLQNSNAAANAQEPTYFTLCTIKINEPKKSEKTAGVNLLNNSTVDENDDLESFPLTLKGGSLEDDGGANFRPEIDEDGYEGRCLKIVSDQLEEKYNDDGGKGWTTWSTQFFLKLNEKLPEGTKVRASMMIKADSPATITLGAHGNPRSWSSGLDGNFEVDTDWDEYVWEGTVSADMARNDGGFGSFAMDLNQDFNSNTFYFDNIKVEKLLPVNDVQHQEDAVQILFTELTNMPEIVKTYADGKSRLITAPKELVKVTVAGVEAPIGTVEYDREGQLMIFLDEDYVIDHPIEEGQEVVVTFNNTTDEMYRLVWAEGDKNGEAVESFTLTSVYNEDLGLLSFAYGAPGILSSDPEDKSFCISGDLREFKVTFDKGVQCKYIKAKLDNSEDLEVTYTEEEGSEILLKRKAANAAALVDGDHSIYISGVSAKTDPDRYEKADFTLTFSVGEARVHENLQSALTEAQSALEANEEDKYKGEAYDALTAAVEKYEAEGITYTAPTQVRAATADLKAKTTALKDHHTLCDDYYTQAALAYELSVSKVKFAATEVYQNLKAAADKYCTVEGEGEEAVVNYLELTEDAKLKAAKDELTAVTKLAEGLLTDGDESKTATKGYAALYERTRLGIEALVALGVDEEDPLIVAAKQAVGDDDSVNEALMKRMTIELYGKLKDGAADELFSEIEDEDGNTTKSGVDMTVFIKNPNLYTVGVGQKSRSIKDNTRDTAPGWSIVCDGGYDVSWSTGWGDYDGTEEIPVDATLTNWACGFTITQTIDNLPVGIYTLKSGLMERTTEGADGWDGQGETTLFAMTAGVEDIADAIQTPILYEEGHVGTQDFGSKDKMSVEDIEVLDGALTIGVKTNGHTHLFLNNFALEMVGAAEDFNYADAYTTDIDAAKTAKVRAIELYDLNGHRLSKAGKGLTIVKKMMSDGTVKTSKVVK